MIIFVYIFLIILPIAFILDSRNSQFSKITITFLGALIYFLVIGLATYNNDWLGYALKFEGTIPTTELFYKYLFKIFRDGGYSFKDFYLFNQLLNSLLLIIFIRNFNPNVALIIVALVLILIGPSTSILLRFYTSFLFFINGVTFFLYNGKKILGLILIVLSLLSHFSSIIFLIFFIIHRLKMFNMSVIFLLFIAFITALSKDLLFILLNRLGYENFIYYLIGPTSTLNGGLLASLPVIPWIFLVLKTHISIKNKNILYDKKYVILFSMSIFPILLLFLSFTIQIVLFRFIEPAIIIFVLY